MGELSQLGYYNGTWGALDTIMVPMNDRVSYFGDGVYDATYSRKYKIFTLDEHVDRFFNSAALLRIDLGRTKDEIKAVLYEMLSHMETGENFVYWQATRGTGPRYHKFPEDGQMANLWIMIRTNQIVDMSKKIQLITIEDTRFLHCNIKTLNLLPNVMAAQAAKEAGAGESVYCRGDIVTECAHSNVHILKNGVFKTHPTDHYILPGIARMNLINTCKKLNIPVDETPFTVRELFEADEIIVSSAGSFCIAADVIDGKAVGGKATALLKKIQDELYDKWMQETE